MRTARKIYEMYQVPPWLQTHQVRVAAVGKMVAEAQKQQTDVDLVVRTCLVHDIGAIVKFDFSPEGQTRVLGLCPPEETPHWSAVQCSMRERYGEKEKAATSAILHELGLEREYAVYDRTGFKNMHTILEGKQLPALLVQYADMRVGPFGIVTLRERFEDSRVRYAHVSDADWYAKLDMYERVAGEVERHLLRDTSLRSADINDASVDPLIHELWDYDIA